MTRDEIDTELEAENAAYEAELEARLGYKPTQTQVAAFICDEMSDDDLVGFFGYLADPQPLPPIAVMRAGLAAMKSGS